MDIFFWHCFLVGCVFTATVCCSENVAMQRQMTSNLNENQDDAVAAEDHEHHRIIIVVPKEMPHHVNHVHTYKLSGNTIPLIHTGKPSPYGHKHAGAYGHQHKHLGHVRLVAGGKGKAPHHYVRLQQRPRAPVDHRPQLRTAAHQLHLRQQQQQHQGGDGVDYRVQQHGPGGGTSGVLGPVPGAVGRGPVSGQVHFVPSSRPHGLGSFIPHEIQQYVRHDARLHSPQQHQYAPPPQHYVQPQQKYAPPAPQQYNNVRPPQPPLRHQSAADDDDDEAEPPGYNVIHLRVPDQGGPEIIKHVDIDLTNDVAKLQTGERAQQPAVTANYKSVTQYNKVIGHGRAVAPSAEEEFDAQSADDEDGDSGGELLLEDVGYRFGEGYRLAMQDAGGASGGVDYSAAQEHDDEELDEFSKEPSMNAEFVDPTDGQTYSQTYTMQY